VVKKREPSEIKSGSNTGGGGAADTSSITPGTAGGGDIDKKTSEGI